MSEQGSPSGGSSPSTKRAFINSVDVKLACCKFVLIGTAPQLGVPLCKRVSERLAPKRLALLRSAPTNEAPDNVALSKRALVNIVPDKSALLRSAATKEAPEKSSPHKSAPTRVAPARFAPRRSSTSRRFSPVSSTPSRSRRASRRDLREIIKVTSALGS